MTSSPPPQFSILTPVFDPPLDVLRACLKSVARQRFDDWEHCLVDDASTNPEVRRVLAEAARVDPRRRVQLRRENGGIVAASNDALAMARGTFVGLLDHDDALDPAALSSFDEALAGRPNADYAYSDEAVVTQNGHLVGEFRKPDWSPERLRGQMYTCHFSVLRRTLVEEVGGFHVGFDGAQDYDLVLRVTERARDVVHVPHVMYYWRQVPSSTAHDSTAKPYAFEAGRRAVAAHCERIGIDGEVESIEPLGCYRIQRRLDRHPLVSVIIPTRGSRGRVWGIERTFVLGAVRSIVDRSTYHPDAIEFVVVADTPTPAATLQALQQIAPGRMHIVPYDRPFNFSEKMNLGFVHARGEHVLLLNDDVEVVSPEWLEAMVSLLQQGDVGMVGAKLLFSDGTVQHGGHAYQGAPGHALFRHPGGDPGPHGMLRLVREASGVTAACALIPRCVFAEVGGLAQGLGGNYNDVDLSLKVRATGRRILWTPDAVLYHFESQTREPTVTAADANFIFNRWGRYFGSDPYVR